MSPHAPPLRGSLPPEGADPAWGGPAPDRCGPHAHSLRVARCPNAGKGPGEGLRVGLIRLGAARRRIAGRRAAGFAQRFTNCPRAVGCEQRRQ